MDLTKRYIHFQRIYGFGEGQLNFLKNLINITGTLQVLNFIKLYFPEYAPTFLMLAPVAVVTYIVIGYTIGTILDKKFKMVNESKRWDNERDPAIREILERLRRIERQRL